VRNGIVILLGKKGSGRNSVAKFLRNRGVTSLVKKGKIAQSCCTALSRLVGFPGSAGKAKSLMN
jgi:dephospho-CoA kinase